MKTPPISPYGIFTGTLFQYKSCPSLVAFESLPPPCDGATAASPPRPNKCILVGGLSDGLIPTPYASALESRCRDSGWSLVQPVLSSSYLGFGNGSLDRDTKEITELMEYLIEHNGAENFALVGHSTGCQNSVHFLKHGEDDLVRRTKVVALQAPASDREGASVESGYTDNIETARQMRSEGKEDEMMPRSAFWAPITAARFLSLQDVGGNDDFFSSDLTDDELDRRLGHVSERGAEHGLRLLAAFSGQDEYVPSHVDKVSLLERLCRAMNQKCIKEGSDQMVAIPLMLEEGNHNLSKSEGDGERFVEAVADLLRLATTPR